MWAIIHLVLFVLAYKMADIYAATQILMATSLLEVLHSKYQKKNLEKSTLWTTVLIWVFGSMTLFLKDPQFIMLKPTIIYVLFGLALIISEIINKPIFKNMLEKNMEDKKEKIEIDPNRSKVFSYGFGVFNLLLAVINYYFAMYTTEDLWIQFKIYSSVAVAIALFGFMIYLILPNIKEKQEEKES